jgi:hypothetical protein
MTTTTTAKEQEVLDWCYRVLDEDQIRECHEQALEMAEPAMYEDEAADLLIPLLVKIMIRHAKQKLRHGDPFIQDDRNE